jgi:hypothetical protein
MIEHIINYKQIIFEQKSLFIISIAPKGVDQWGGIWLPATVDQQPMSAAEQPLDRSPSPSRDPFRWFPSGMGFGIFHTIILYNIDFFIKFSI